MRSKVRNIQRGKIFLLILAGLIIPAFGTGLGGSTTPVAVSSFASPTLTGTYFDHVVIIVMEDHGINQICAHNPPSCLSTNGDPYMAGLANQYGIGSQYLGISHFSQANYIALLGGDIYGCTGYPCQPSSHVNLVDRFEAAGLTWRGYMESQGPTSGCATTSNTLYTLEHNPFVFFTDITSNPARCSNIFLANPTSCTITDCVLVNDLNSASAPNFMFLTPNECDNMHGVTGACSASIPMGDQYLSSLVPNILNSQTFTTQRSALFITFDEGNGYCPLNKSSEDCVYAVWAGTGTKKAFVTSNLYNHYSFTKTIETNWNLASLATNDAAATPLTEFFSPTAQPPLSASFTFSPSSPNTGANVTFTATASGGTQPYSFTWSFGDGSTGTGSTTAHTYTVSGSYNVVLTVKDTSSPQQTITSQKTVVVANPPPPLATSFTFNPSSPLVGQLVSFVGSASGGTSPYTFNWNFGDGITATGGSVSHAYSSRGTFTVNLNTMDSAGKTASASANVTVTPTALTADFTSSPSNVTTGSPVTFTATVSGGTSPYTYSWSFGDGSTATANPVTHSYATSGSFAVQLLVTDSAGANATASHTVTVTPPPLSASFSFSPGQPNVGQLVNFTGSASGGSPPYSFNWSFGDGTISTGNIASHSYSTAGTFTVQLTLQDSTGTTVSTSHSITVTKPVPPDFTISPNPVTLRTAPGGSVSSTITLASNGGFAGTISLYATISPNDPTVSINPASVTLVSGGTGTSTLMVTTQASAPIGNYTITITGNSTSLSHTSTVLLSVQLAPDFSFSANPSTINIPRTTSGIIALSLSSLNEFNGTVNVSVTVSRPGLRTTLSSSSINLVPGGHASDNLTIKALKRAPVGSYTVTVTAINGTITHTTTITVNVT